MAFVACQRKDSENFARWLGCEGAQVDVLATLSTHKCKNMFITVGRVEFPTTSESPHYSYNDKVPFVGPHHLPKLRGKKLKATTKVTLQAINELGGSLLNKIIGKVKPSAVSKSSILFRFINQVDFPNI